MVYAAADSPVFAANKEKDEDTLRQAKVVLQDLVRQDISPALLSKADCVSSYLV